MNIRYYYIKVNLLEDDTIVFIDYAYKYDYQVQ